MFVVDTNVLVYAADRDSPCHDRCRQRVEEWRRQASPWYVCWPTLYEFLRVTTHPRVFRRPFEPRQAWAFIETVLAAPALRVLAEGERHSEMLLALISGTPQLTGNLFHDAHVVALMREHGISVIYTRDTDFHRFSGIEVRDPLV